MMNKFNLNVFTDDWSYDGFLCMILSFPTVDDAMPEMDRLASLKGMVPPLVRLELIRIEDGQEVARWVRGDSDEQA